MLGAGKQPIFSKICFFKITCILSLLPSDVVHKTATQPIVHEPHLIELQSSHWILKDTCTRVFVSLFIFTNAVGFANKYFFLVCACAFDPYKMWQCRQKKIYPTHLNIFCKLTQIIIFDIFKRVLLLSVTRQHSRNLGSNTRENKQQVFVFAISKILKFWRSKSVFISFAFRKPSVNRHLMLQDKFIQHNYCFFRKAFDDSDNLDNR